MLTHTCVIVVYYQTYLVTPDYSDIFSVYFLLEEIHTEYAKSESAQLAALC